MASPINAYNTSKTGPEAPKEITKTDCAGDKVALDVALCTGSIVTGQPLINADTEELTLLAGVAKLANLTNSGGANLAGRRMIRLFNDSGAVVAYGYDATVTIAGATRGESINNGIGVTIMLTDAQDVYVIKTTAGNMLVTEFK